MAKLSKLDETINQLEEQAELLKKYNDILATVSKISDQIEKGVSDITEANNNFNVVKKEIQDSLKSINESIDKLEKKNDLLFSNLIDSNKKFLRELEDIISSKLERFSSDIQVSLRSSIRDLQEALQNHFNIQINNLELKQEKLFSRQMKQFLWIKILLFLVISLCIGLGTGLFIFAIS